MSQVIENGVTLNRIACGDFVNFDICLLSLLKVLIRQCLRTCVHMSEYACIAGVDVVCNSKKRFYIF